MGKLTPRIAAAALALAGAAAGAATTSSSAPAQAKASAFVASYDVILTGGTSRQRHHDSQSGENSVVYESDDAYSGRGILTLKEESNGALVPSSNSFAYQSATWSLSGQNGQQGSFSCNPPITTTDGTVDASGFVVGGVLYVRFRLAGTHEHNDDYDCGAGFTGFATDSTYEAQSLDEIQDAQAGGWIVTSSDHPSVGTLTHTIDTGTAPNTFHSDTSWTFSIVKRSGSAHDDGPPGPNTAPGPNGGIRHVCTITGTRHNDVLNGTPGDDVICGLGGNDRINGRGGHDLIYGGLGKDRINARDKTVDRVDGGPGKDQGTFDRSPRDRVVRVERASFG